MSDDKTPDSSIYNEMIKIGLADPFVKAIVGIVAVATAAGFVISILGNGLNAVLAVGFSLMFGVVLVVLRVLMKNTDSKFVRVLCLASVTVIVGVFLALLVLIVPAATVCLPRLYGETLGLQACKNTETCSKPFEATPYAGKGIVVDPANHETVVLVFYRCDRQADAQRLVGALLAAGYYAEGTQSSLNEVVAPNRSPGVTLIKTTTAARPTTDDILRVARLANPVAAETISVFPNDTKFIRGNIQIDLF
jgi:hypothetical protein